MIAELGDRVVSIGKLRIRGKGSGIEVTVSTAIVLTFSDGKIVRFEDFVEKSRALEAVGLGKPGAQADSS